MLRLWYYRWKYGLSTEPEPLVNREARVRRWRGRMNLVAIGSAFLIACLAVALFHFVSA